MSGDKFQVRLTGENATDVATVAKTPLAVDGLFAAVADEAGIKFDGLRLTGFRRVCDGCEAEVTNPHQREGLDYCDECWRSTEGGEG